MWGDNPRDYQTFEFSEDGFKTVVLPHTERLSCGCEVELEWLRRYGEQYAVGCIAVRQLYRPECLHPWDCAKAEELAKKLFDRYTMHCTGKGE
jgi:hypothetical protein